MNSYRGTLAGCMLMGALLVMTGCATAGAGGGGESSRDVITRQEIQETDVSNLYEVVRRLRPTWLRVRNKSFSKQTEIVVVRDGTVIGNVEALRDIGRDGINEIRFMDGETAAATLVGARSGYVAGAIVIERG